MGDSNIYNKENQLSNVNLVVLDHYYFHFLGEGDNGSSFLDILFGSCVVVPRYPFPLLEHQLARHAYQYVFQDLQDNLFLFHITV